MADVEYIKNCDDEASTSRNDDDDVEQAEEGTPETRIIPGFQTFENYLQETYDVLRTGIKVANNLPAGANYNYYTCFSSFNDSKNKSVKMILDTMQFIIKTAGGSGKIEHRDIDDQFELLLETNDLLLDRANMCMDEESGINQKPEVQLIVTQASKPTVNGSWNTKTHQTVNATDSQQNIRLLGGKNVQRPQLMFKDKINNTSKPWQPRIKEKPNSLKPLALYLEEGEYGEVFNHPYEFELNRFEIPERQLKKRVPVKYKSLNNTQLIYVDNPSDITIALEHLKNYNEIAVDLEHHSYRTFQGITCLMQISTVDTDYLVDTLALRSELHQLNEIFTKPSILKVFHGADSDIQWLQRDLSLYVVNMFDTYQAAKQLKLPYLSLAYLLKKYCNIDPNKHFQLADWRIRPLPEELMKYAREDTHYLLYIKDMLRNELIEAANGQNNILKAVYDQSTEICKRTYVKPIWTEESCMNMYRKSQKMFNNKQMYAFKELHKWRDGTAREEDDSIGYVLPNHMLLNIAETLPREMQGILACCNPIPPLVRQNLLKLHKIVLKAREQPLIKSIPEDDFRQRLTQRSHVVNSEAWIYAPHDVPSGTEARADLPCLLDKEDTGQLILDANVTVKHTVTVFDSPVTSEVEEETQDSGIKKNVFVSPFKRYKCVIPMVAEQEAKEREMQRKKEEEESLKETDKNVNIEQKEIQESISRVHDHFKQVSQMKLNEETQNSSKKKKKKKKKNKNPTLLLSQMQDRKRKRESNIAKGNQNVEQKSNDSFFTPTPSLDTRIIHIPKKVKLEMENMTETRKLQETFVQIQKNNNPEIIKPIRSRKKGDKKTNANQLKQQGMLPSDKFNYKTIDFSSFQGGSTTNDANQIQFQQSSQKKKKDRHRNWKKPKFNI